MKSNLDARFWVTLVIPLIGAMATGLTMFHDLKQEFNKTKIEVEYIKDDMRYIKTQLYRIDNKMTRAPIVGISGV